MDSTSLFKSDYFQLRLYIVLSVLLLAVIGYFTFNNVMKYLDVQAQIQTNNEIYDNIQSNEEAITEELEKEQAEIQELNETIQSQLEIVFPEKESHTKLTRTLEQFANDIHRIKNPFIINNLQYLDAEQAEGEDYSILPFKMTIHSSYSNFFKFLEFVESSGALSDGTRLIQITTISINFVSPSGAAGNISGKDEINFNATMNAYFRSTTNDE
jgi:Tfp pilus assembly protein PilO